MWNKIMEQTLVFKTMVGLFFSAGIIIYVVFGFMLGVREISFEMIVQLFFLSIFVTCLQYLLWEDESKVKLNTFNKLLIQYFLLGAVLLGMSQLFDWFVIGTKTFYKLLLLYHFIYLGGIFGFSLYYKVLGMRFNKKMLHYQEQKQGN
ncbi:hypothetical protein [Fictibacillus phosphorivorans]|uniref:hypothetical protein n=1 Tax=Fictibacillus phosphorivorans TaxID=1221500 RepID=UPI00203CF265|nr:hypothetical protein [Fictibacillus phosphorivorans]MCM3719478.1 hypothetical protein [Fictibacillus phosphorivorans]MCM3777169.1 hypothetical protein [Fictibacillus phosphorivorans]